jgi:hypothetical protein
MNDHEAIQITNYDQLVAERVRIEKLIENQKNIIRHDLDELKAEFKKEIRPAVEAASFVKKLALPETRKATMFSLGANLTIDLLLKRILKGKNVIAQVLIPKVAKNLISYFITGKKTQPPPSRSLNRIKHSIHNGY